MAVKLKKLFKKAKNIEFAYGVLNYAVQTDMEGIDLIKTLEEAKDSLMEHFKKTDADTLLIRAYAEITTALHLLRDDTSPEKAIKQAHHYLEQRYYRGKERV